MKTTRKQMATELSSDVDKVVSTFRIIKDKLQLESDSMTDKTVFYIISQKSQVRHLTSIMDDYLEKLKASASDLVKQGGRR